MGSRTIATTFALSSMMASCGLVAGLDSYQDVSDAGDLTASSGDGSMSMNTDPVDATMTSNVDATTAPVGDLDATTLTEPDTSFDAYVPPPPNLGDGCMGSAEDGEPCTMASTCCGGFCSEQRKCTSSCKGFNDGCSRGQCCSGFYCTLNIGFNTCAQCIPKGVEPPEDYEHFQPYNEACCSGSSSLYSSKEAGVYALCN